MCEPTTITMAAIAIGGAVAGVVGQSRTANAQEDALNAQAQVRAEENQDAAEEALGERVREGRKERSRIRVAAGESGVGGASLNAQLRDSVLQQSLDSGIIRKQTSNNQRAAEAVTRSAMSNVTKPTALSAGLQIAGAGTQGYYQGLQIKKAREGK